MTSRRQARAGLACADLPAPVCLRPGSFPHLGSNQGLTRGPPLVTASAPAAIGECPGLPLGQSSDRSSRPFWLERGVEALARLPPLRKKPDPYHSDARETPHNPVYPVFKEIYHRPVQRESTPCSIGSKEGKLPTQGHQRSKSLSSLSPREVKPRSSLLFKVGQTSFSTLVKGNQHPPSPFLREVKRPFSNPPQSNSPVYLVQGESKPLFHPTHGESDLLFTSARRRQTPRYSAYGESKPFSTHVERIKLPLVIRPKRYPRTVEVVSLLCQETSH